MFLAFQVTQDVLTHSVGLVYLWSVGLEISHQQLETSGEGRREGRDEGAGWTFWREGGKDQEKGGGRGRDGDLRVRKEREGGEECRGI